MSVNNPNGIRAYVGGKAGNDRIQATNDKDGTILNGGAGDDQLLGGRFNDILSGGEGNDIMYGGLGSDQFRFFFDDVTGVDSDKIIDLDFGQGDTLVLGGYAGISDAEGLDAFAGGTSAIISSIEGLVNLVNGSEGSWTVRQKFGTADVMFLTYEAGEKTQIIEVNGWQAYAAAAGLIEQS